MDDAEREHDGTIDSYFGSTGATITLRVADSEASGVFAYGYCALLAYVLHKKTGMPLIVFTLSGDTSDSWQGHAGVLVGDNKVLDITGISSIQEIDSKYRRYEKFNELSSVTVMGRDDFLALTVSEEYRDNPLFFLDELERYITNDFADWLITLYREDFNVKVVNDGNILFA